MKVLIDTNVIVDVLQSREPWCRQGQAIFLAAANRRITGCITAKEAAVILVNCGDQETALTLKTWRIGAARDAEMRLALKVNQSFEEYLPIHNGETSLTVPPKSGAVYLICERQEGNP